MNLFEVKNLSVSVEDKEIIKNFSLEIKPGEVHAIMGKNGSGKTTLSMALMGHPSYEVTSGKVLLAGEDITELETEEKAKKGLFLGMQYPVAIPGVSVGNFLRVSLKNIWGDKYSPLEIRKKIKEEAEKMKVPSEFLSRSLNDGFSGGEKKKLETLQLALLQPRFAIMDETDSGLDIDALKSVAEKMQSLRTQERAFLIITHYQRLLNYLKPDKVHVMIAGKIVKTGGPELALELEEKGYEGVVPGSLK
ncbi:MAG: Fe-S cluster assembly ATPase SufC [Bdellovibrionota bacterium]